MSKELAKTYDPKDIEDRIYADWLENKYFHAEVDHSKTPFTIVIPPPNITGQLHMGHALDNTMQDILIRYKRMQGYNALWQPGTDHASIATEVKIIETLKSQGISKEDLGREGFLERAWDWKKEYGGRIVSQLKKLGSSCDWDRERFTMDEGCNRAVNEVFCKMYKKGWIYKGSRRAGTGEVIIRTAQWDSALAKHLVWLPELFGPGKGTKRRPNRVWAFVE